MQVAVDFEAFGDCYPAPNNLLSAAGEASSPWSTVGGDSNSHFARLTTREAVAPFGSRHRLHNHRIGAQWRWHLPGELVWGRRVREERLSVHLDAVKEDINLGVGAPGVGRVLVP